MNRLIHSKNAFNNSIQSFFHSTLSYSLWPLDESISSFFKENKRVYESDHHWIFLRSVCLDTSSLQLYLYNDSSSYSHLPFSLSSLQHIQESDVSSPSRFSWFLFASSEYDTLLPQLALLHSVAVHPDRYPPVHVLSVLHRRLSIFTLRTWRTRGMTCSC